MRHDHVDGLDQRRDLHRQIHRDRIATVTRRRGASRSQSRSTRRATRNPTGRRPVNRPSAPVIVTPRWHARCSRGDGDTLDDRDARARTRPFKVPRSVPPRGRRRREHTEPIISEEKADKSHESLLPIVQRPAREKTGSDRLTDYTDMTPERITTLKVGDRHPIPNRRRLGSGGMGQVYLALDTKLPARWIKLVDPRAGKVLRTWCAKRDSPRHSSPRDLHHPAWDYLGEEPFLAWSTSRVCPLSKVIRSRRSVSGDDRPRLRAPDCGPVAHAHDRGVIPATSRAPTSGSAPNGTSRSWISAWRSVLAASRSAKKSIPPGCRRRAARRARCLHGAELIRGSAASVQSDSGRSACCSSRWWPGAGRLAAPRPTRSGLEHPHEPADAYGIVDSRPNSRGRGPRLAIDPSGRYQTRPRAGGGAQAPASPVEAGPGGKP